MNNIIIGTAGHVDHGKTALIRALTGINTDRLEDEQKRGITIDLGFANLPLPDGGMAGIIDVPGHEKFIKNMLAGAGGIDLVLLVVAADDGVMPQTQEHMDILNLLEARTGIIVLTKADLVDEEWIEMITEQIQSAVSETFLAEAPVMPVSSHTGEGIDELKELIYKTVSSTRNKNGALPFRLPIDRVFTMEGFGSVVTGTLIEGVLRKGEDITLYPSGRSSRVRNLQVHSQDVDTAYAGQRVAVNLGGLNRNDVVRGDTLGAPGSMTNSLLADVKLQILNHCERVIKHGSRLHFYHGARDLLCRLVLLDKSCLQPGEAGYAQLRFSEEIALKKGDHFIVRFYSPLETVGGGIVLNPVAMRHKRHDPATIEALKIREHGSLTDHVEQAITDASDRLAPLNEIMKQFDLETAAFQEELDTLVREKRIYFIGRKNAVSAEFKQETGYKLTELLSAYHKGYPLLEGMRKDELRSRLFPGIKPVLWDNVLDLFVEDGSIRCTGQQVALSGFTITYSEAEKNIREKIKLLFSESGFSAPPMDRVYEICPKDKKTVDRVFEAMIAQGVLVFAAPGIFYSAPVIEKAKEVFRTISEENGGSVALAQFRDGTDTSRKFALALLEYLDKCGFTRKKGDVRVLV